MTDFVAWHNKNLAEHTNLRDKYMQQGYRFLSLSIYSYTPFPFYAAVMIKRPGTVTQHDYSEIASNAFQQTFDIEAANGFGPVIIAADRLFMPPCQERDSLYARQASLYPRFAEYQRHTKRIIPVIALTPKT